MKALDSTDTKLLKTDKEPINKNNDNNQDSYPTDSEKKMDTYAMNTTNYDLNANQLEANSIKLMAKILGINEKEYSI